VRRALLAAVVAVLLVTAGCSGDGPTTPEPNPDRTTTPESPAFPPGVSASGVENITRLLDAHAAAALVDGAAVDITVERTGRVDGRAVTESVDGTAELAVDAAALELVVERTTTEGDETVERVERRWANESVLVTRTVANGTANTTVEARTRNVSAAVRSATTRPEVLRETLSSAWFTVVQTEYRPRSEQWITVLRAEDGSYVGDRPVTEYRATVVVDDTGHVRALKRSWTVDTESRTVEYTAEYEWTPFASVDRPAWVGNATASD
jgi:hypothetical protein